MRIRRSAKLLGIAWLACGAWLGCNAILGNESAEFDPDAAARPDGSTNGDDGTTGDGTTGDGSADGTIDGDIDGGDDAGPCVDLATNPRHCGACNHDCRGGGCADGGCLPIVLATDLPGPETIAIDSTHLYWINALTNDVWSVQHDGGSKKKIYDGPEAGAGTSLAIHGGNIYFASEADVDASVLRCATPGCGGGPAVEVANRDVPVSVFVTPAGQLHLTQTVPSGSVERCQLPCTLGTQIVVNGVAQSFAANVAVGADGTLFWTNLNGSPNKLMMFPSGGTPTSIAEGNITAVTPASGEVYYIDEAKGPSAVPLDGGPSRRLRTIGTAGRHLALDTTVVYATESTQEFVYACDRANGCGDAGVILAKNQSIPRGITFNAQFIFWANDGDVGTGGQIMRLAR